MSERGVKETKEVLAFVFSMTNAIKVSLADGDFDFWDAKNFVEPLKKIGASMEENCITTFTSMPKDRQVHGHTSARN